MLCPKNNTIRRVFTYPVKSALRELIGMSAANTHLNQLVTDRHDDFFNKNNLGCLRVLHCLFTRGYTQKRGNR